MENITGTMSDQNQFVHTKSDTEDDQKSDNKLQLDCQVADVKSSAIVKCTAVEPPSCFQKLSSNTDLNQPPANWLKSNTKWQGRFGQWTYPKKSSAFFSSFKMANTFTDCIGEVDVISDAENIKKLLKIPYSKAHISMMVHRVGKTILLDEFDIHRHLLRASQKQWEWLRKFYYDHILESCQEKEKCMLRKSKTRENLQNKNMFSKFLYYSLPDPHMKQEIPSEPESDACTDTCINQKDRHEDVHQHPSSDTPLQLFSWNTPKIPDPIVESEDQGLNDTHEFLRKVLWTFEDIRMLVGSDMPIFGGGTRPAVSLRLRDMHKPINVLTGLDYWLDNLMCNVPEVMMCYHLDGIVQKYEVIKTEDIPYLKHSQFSPKLVKDIAQNILSFLKSNATKSGHTYWLFKGKDDDVVKLYDLTTLCADMMDEKEQNPFAFPVAMLLYRVAQNMKESLESHRKQGTIHKLLKNCLSLLDPQKHPQIVTSAHYLLADLFVPNKSENSFGDSSLLESEGDVENEDENFDEDLEEKYDIDEHGHLISPSVEVKALCFPTTYREDAISDVEKAPQIIDKNFDQKCHEAIKHISQGLVCVLSDRGSDVSTSFTESKQSSTQPNQEDEVKMAKPFEAIPLHYASLKKDSVCLSFDNQQQSSEVPNELRQRSCGACFCDSESHAVTAMTNMNPSWKECCKILLLLKATQVYSALSENSSSLSKFGLALKYVKLGIMCYTSAQAVIASHGTKCHTDPLAFLLGLAGDIHLMMVQGDQNVSREYHKEQFEFVTDDDAKMLQLLDEVGDNHESGEFDWVYEWTTTLEANLLSSFRCYQMARHIWPEGRQDGWVRLMQRIGNVCNELGVFYMSQITRIWNEDAEHTKEKLDALSKKSHGYLEDGIAAFTEVNDINNIALLHSNIGRLMRICAHSHVHISSSAVPKEGSCREFSMQERHYYNRAIQSYQKALRTLGQRSHSQDVWDTVTWELCTTFYNMGCLLQDYAPLSTMAQEKIEKEVTEVMFKALKLCDSETSSSRQLLYSYRMASIHHRLGSLYHHACRNHLCSGERQKQLRTLAERHYSKACDIFDNLENNNEFLRVLLERIGMYEHHVANLSGFSSKLKTLHSLFELAISAEAALNRIIFGKNGTKDSVQTSCAVEEGATKDSDDDEANEQRELLSLFRSRLQFNIESVIKVYKPKMSKFEAIFKKWKDVLSDASEVVEADKLEQHLLHVLQEIRALIVNSNR